MLFRNLANSIVDILRSNSIKFGIGAEDAETFILPGNPTMDIPTSAPFVYVYALPGDFLNNTQTVSGQVASVAITCGVEIQNSINESIIVGTERCSEAMKLLNIPQRGIFIAPRYANPPIEFDNITDVYTSCKLLFTTEIEL